MLGEQAEADPFAAMMEVDASDTGAVMGIGAGDRLWGYVPHAVLGIGAS